MRIRYRSCPWKYLQPSTSIFKYSPTSRKFIQFFFFFLPNAIALTHGFNNSSLSGPLCLLFCNKTGPITGKEK